ncbi:MAG TPA: ABC transporter permease [Thermoanaerobaculia bacterium]|nr:ABC transporter permease [Thermoanaerobaculia bacterium]
MKGSIVNREVVAMAADRFRKNPVQTSLTLAGFIVGTASIILVVSLGLTGRGYVLAQIEGVGSRLVWANYRGTVTSGVSRANEDFINESDVKAVAARTDLFTGVTGLVTVRGSVSVQSQVKTLTALGAMANYVPVRRNLRVLRGRFLDEEDVLQRARVCVVNRSLYEALFANDDSGEKTLRTLGTTFRVIGEFEEPVDTLGRGDVVPETVFIPVTVAWSYLPVKQQLNTLFAEVREFSELPAAVRTVEEILRERHHPGSVYEVESMTTVVRLARAISAGLIVVFVLAAAISVVVGGVGIMNILLASVEQRTREIGVRMSVGARRADILGQFLVEALALGMTGSLVGVAIGLGVPLLARSFVPVVPIRVSFLSAGFAFAFSCAVALVFGAVPAYRASRLNPAEAVHRE